MLIAEKAAIIDPVRNYLGSMEDWEFHVAQSAAEAYHLLDNDYDLILCSYTLADKNGIEVLKDIRSRGLKTSFVLLANQIVPDMFFDLMRNDARFFFYTEQWSDRELRELKRFLLDIIHRKKVEDDLNRREKDFRAIVTNSVDSILVVDHDGYVLYANPAATELFSMPKTEFTGKMFGFPVIMYEPVDMYILKEFKKFVAVEMRMAEVTWGGNPSNLVLLRDITERLQYEEELKLAREELEERVKQRTSELEMSNSHLQEEIRERLYFEKALQRSENQYRRLVDMAHEGIWVLDRQDKTNFVNSRLAHILGYLPDEMIGTSLDSYITGDSIRLFKSELLTRKQGERVSLECEIIAKDRSKIIASVVAAPIYDEQSRFEGSVAFVSDITARKRAEEDLKKAQAQAELYLDLMGHDINNMNQIGMGYLEMAQESSDLDELKALIVKPLEVMRNTSRIIANVRKLQKATIEEKVASEIDLCSLLSGLITEYQNIKGRDIVLDLEKVPDCAIRANELMKEVFINLIDNAIKHSDPSKPLKIGIRFRHFSQQGKEYLMCTLEDNGPGIPDWMKDKIFERYHRGPTKAHGKGLGLFIVRTIMEDVHGKIWVENRVPGDYSKGSKFVLVFQQPKK